MQTKFALTTADSKRLYRVNRRIPTAKCF